MTALEAAREHLSAVIEGAKNQRPATMVEEDKIETTAQGELTKSESYRSCAECSCGREGERRAEGRRGEQDKNLRPMRAEKNANNGGDVSTADIKPTGPADADDVKSDGGRWIRSMSTRVPMRMAP